MTNEEGGDGGRGGGKELGAHEVGDGLIVMPAGSGGR